ncbi:hamartin-like isoform X1 [Tigriopus californicus]|uniref:hamartin-like isoform X1 n=1 Tax=Tigriopus californicus TaxID=6832 RepID=UPI0027D9EB84|nr:hamartin-like isoform X1 [Tigriopus californicus]
MAHPVAQGPPLVANSAPINSLEDLFRILESGQPNDVVQEIQQIIHEQFNEVKEPYLVNGLYDYCQSKDSPGVLDLLLSVPDPHDKFLFDKILESLRQSGSSRLHGLSILGYIVRKQPPWLYKVTQHAVMKEIIRILKNEEDLMVLMSALMDLLALMPIVPTYVGPFLHDLFDAFSRLASWRYVNLNDLPQIQKIHVQIGLYAFFHRLYGMFPCNFLSYLRSQYSETHKDHQLVFNHTIRPMLHTVRMHPLLVTHSRDQEKNSARWKKLELHDVLVESSRYSLISQESTKEDQLEPLFSPMNPYGTMRDISAPDIRDICSVINHDPFWTPGKRLDVSSPPVMPASNGKSVIPSPVSIEAATTKTSTASSVSTHNTNKLTVNLSQAQRNITPIESPPEAAIEATPESTPFVTPVKDDTFRFVRPGPTVGVSRQLRLDSVPPPRSPKVPHPLSPMKEHASPFRFDRRDSIFVDQLPGGAPGGFSKLGGAIKLDTPDSPIPSKDTPIKADDVWSSRPSPVKFTNQRPDQFPIKPEPERPELFLAAKMRALDEALDDPGKEEEDPEVSNLTGGQGLHGIPGETPDPRDLSTRHITPRICGPSCSGTPSRATSRLSSSSQPDPPAISSRPRSAFQDNSSVPSVVGTPSGATPAIATECISGGLHAPSTESVHDLVRQVRGRIRYFSMCAPGELEIQREVQDVIDEENKPSVDSHRHAKRASSCPEEHLMHQMAMEHHGGGIRDGIYEETKDSAVQTDEYVVFPYEHLFPSVIPMAMLINTNGSKRADPEPNPYEDLDRCVESAIADLESKNGSTSEDPKVLKNQLLLLHNALLFERHRREILGTRNRRLLGKTKSSRILEEENTALRDQLQIVETEIASLLDQLELVRKEKHRMEEARGKEAKQRDEQIEELVSEKANLKETLREMNDKLSRQADEMKRTKQEMIKLEAGLFRANSEIHVLEQKDKSRKCAESEVVRLRQEIILLGEIHQKFREQLIQQPATINHKRESLYIQAFENQLGAMENSLMSKSADLEGARARINDLEQIVTKKDINITELKKMIKIIKEENLENVSIVEGANETLIETQGQLEAKILQLQDKLSQASRGAVRRGGGVTHSIGGVSASSYRPPGFLSHSANVDIRQPIPESEAISTDSADKSFIVGSPPLSSDNGSFPYSLGSNEALRRAISSGPINLDQFVEVAADQEHRERGIDRNVSEPEIGSAVSAVEAMRASSSTSSMNGRH